MIEKNKQRGGFMKGFKNFKYEKQKDGVTATKHYDNNILFTYQNNDFDDVYTGITKINRSILKLIPNKYIELAGGYDNLDVVGIKCTIYIVYEEIVLLISLKNCKTIKLTITKKYLQDLEVRNIFCRMYFYAII